MNRWEMEIPGWQPTPLNKIMGCHWGTRNRRKKHDYEQIGLARLIYGVLPATGKRRVSLIVTLSKGQRALDPDAYWKVVLDGLVACKALTDDSRQWCEMGVVEFRRGEKGTVIVIEDMV